MENAKNHAVATPLSEHHQASRDAVNSHVDEMIQLLVNILKIGKPYILGYTRPLWVTHLILLNAELDRRANTIGRFQRDKHDFERLKQTFLTLANEFKCIHHLINIHLIPMIPELAKAIRLASQKVSHLQAAYLGVENLEIDQDQMYAWGVSIVTAVGLIGEVFSSKYLYSLRFWPDETDCSVLVVKSANFPVLNVGLMRKTTHDGKAAGKLGPSGGLSKL